MSQPDAVLHLHLRYLEAGADIVRTNTFNANSRSLPAFPDEMLRRLNFSGVEIARTAMAKTGKTCLIAGVIGPNPANSTATGHAQLADALFTQAASLVDAGADLLVAETITRPETSAAVIEAFKKLSDSLGRWIPAIVSLTPLGAPVSAFLGRLSDYPLVAIGLNCVDVTQMAPALEYLSANTPLPVCVYPSAGLPDSTGTYPDATEKIVSQLTDFARKGLVNIAGGCCGTTPVFTQQLATAIGEIRSIRSIR